MGGLFKLCVESVCLSFCRETFLMYDKEGKDEISRTLFCRILKGLRYMQDTKSNLNIRDVRENVTGILIFCYKYP